MITILGRDIPNHLDELTIEQFEVITELSNNKELDAVDKHLQIFASLGLAESEFYDVDVADFIEYTNQFNNIPEIDYPTISQIELAGYNYTAEMKLTVRDTKLIEKIAINKPKGYISDVLAIFFKRDDLTSTEHYAEAHLKLKAKMIKELKANVAIPYLLFITKKLAKQVEAVEDVTETVE
jgi:hypothetical protein